LGGKSRYQDCSWFTRRPRGKRKRLKEDRVSRKASAGQMADQDRPSRREKKKGRKAGRGTSRAAKFLVGRGGNQKGERVNRVQVTGVWLGPKTRKKERGHH